MLSSQIRYRIRGTQLTDADTKLFEGIEAIERQAHVIGYDSGVQWCVNELIAEAVHLDGEGTNPIRAEVLKQAAAALIKLHETHKR